MTLEQIRTALRRQIRDAPGVEWSDDELNQIINQAYALVQKEIRKVDPEAHLFWDYMNIVAGQSWYPLPETFAVTQVDLKDTSSGVYYPIEPKRYRDVGPVRAWSGAVEVTSVTNLVQTYYTLRGQWLGIFPEPTIAVTNGIQLLHCPVMSLSDDIETPRIKVPTHFAIVWWAKLICLGDTDENGGETRTRLQEALGDLGSWYNIHSDATDKLQVSF